MDPNCPRTAFVDEIDIELLNHLVMDMQPTVSTRTGRPSKSKAKHSTSNSQANYLLPSRVKSN